MTITSTLSKKHYQGNGLTREFPIPFPLVDKTHIFAVKRKGTEIQEIRTDFNVDLQRKIFTYPVQASPLQADESLTIYRKMPLTQIVDLQNAGAFHPEVLEYDGFDRLVMQIQQLDEAIERALKIDITDQRDITNLLEQVFKAHTETLQYADLTQKNTALAISAKEKAKAWAESPTPPDSDIEESKSAKTWALYAEDKAHQLTNLQVECRISNDGTGEIIYDKSQNKLTIILPFDNSGSQQPKVILTDKVTENRSDIAGSAKAVKTVNDSLNQKNSALLAKISANIDAIARNSNAISSANNSISQLTANLAQKVDKSSISSSLTSTSTTTVASSKAVKDLNDKITSQLGKVVQKGTRSTTGTWTISGLVVGKPVFIIASHPTYAGTISFETTSGVAQRVETYIGCTASNVYVTPATQVLIPTSTSITLNVKNVAKDVTAYAYQ